MTASIFSLVVNPETQRVPVTEGSGAGAASWSMAPRLDTLDGKTIYIVDDGFVGGINLLQEMVVWFNANYPKTTVVLKRKGGGGFDVEDPQLWAEIKEKANAVIIGMGH